MEITSVRYFSAIVRAGSFNRAQPNSSAITQPSLRSRFEDSRTDRQSTVRTAGPVSPLDRLW